MAGGPQATLAMYKPGTLSDGRQRGCYDERDDGVLIAVGGVSAVSFRLMTRGQNRSAARKSSYDSAGTDANCSSGCGSDGWSIFGWLGSSSFDNSGSSSDFRSGDSGGGGGGAING
jgi:hypothetical protein